MHKEFKSVRNYNEGEWKYLGVSSLFIHCSSFGREEFAQVAYLSVCVKQLRKTLLSAALGHVLHVRGDGVESAGKMNNGNVMTCSLSETYDFQIKARFRRL